MGRAGSAGDIANQQRGDVRGEVRPVAAGKAYGLEEFGGFGVEINVGLGAHSQRRVDLWAADLI